MKDQSNELEKIDKFLSGEMNAEEKTSFEEQIEKDEALREEVALHQDVRLGIGKHQEADLKNKLQQKEAELRQKDDTGKTGKSGKIFWWTAMAAGISLLLVAFFWLFSEDSTQALYAEYYRPYPNVVAPIDRAQPSTINENPYQLYEAGQYAEAIPLFEEQLEQEAVPVVHFYLGLSYLETQQVSMAIEQLKTAAKANHNLSTAARWYLGLGYLQAGEEEEASAIFSQLAGSENDFQEKAQEILEEL